MQNLLKEGKPDPLGFDQKIFPGRRDLTAFNNLPGELLGIDTLVQSKLNNEN